MDPVRGVVAVAWMVLTACEGRSSLGSWEDPDPAASADEGSGGSRGADSVAAGGEGSAAGPPGKEPPRGGAPSAAGGRSTASTGGAPSTTPVGGAPSAGGATNTDGGPPPAPDASVDAGALPNLDGAYDLRFGPAAVSSTPDCTAVYPEQRRPFAVDLSDCAGRDPPCPGTVLYGPSLFGYGSNPAESLREAGQMIFTGFEPEYAHANQEGVERLALDVGPGGFTGSGTATLRRSFCEGRPELVYDVPVSIGPDTTPPLVRMTSPFAPYLVSWGEIHLEADEVLVPWLPGEDPTEFFGLSNASTGAEPALLHPTTMSVAIQSANQDDVAGTAQKLVPRKPFADTVGNPGSVSTATVQFADDTAVNPVLDFDTAGDGALAGAVGAFALRTGAPCEAGRCLVLGPLEPCHQHDGPTFFSLRLEGDQHLTLRVRLAVFSDTSRPAGGLVYYDAVQYIESIPSSLPALWPLEPAPESADGLDYTSGFVDIDIPTQSSEQRGGAFAFDCTEGRDHAKTKVVIERIEAIADPG